LRIARFALQGAVGYGVIEGEPEADLSSARIDLIKAHPFGQIERSGRSVGLDEVRLLAPVLPSKVCAFGRTYAEHAKELGNEVAQEPLLFLKPSTAVCGPGDTIRLPELSDDVQHEAELAVVIGSLCRHVPVERAYEVVLGYTCANDVTARDLQRRDGQWGRAKGFDTFAPLGPWIETEVDAADLEVACLVNGATMQQGRTSQMSLSIAELIAYTSSAMTLLPGDVILTGTPAGVSTLHDGDIVEVRIPGIGSLINPVAKEER
jgi:2-keto-4-pentenoate hydratase/2-oxohepta-3-ene-1,7-dioic acid hydratase in catechol pathway